MHWLFVICLSTVLNLAFFVVPSRSEMFIYPKDGQSAEQQEQDEFTCYKWAKKRTGVDPNQPAARQPIPRASGEAAASSEARWAERRSALSESHRG